MLCAFAIFLLGTPTYRLYSPSPGAESPFARLAHSPATLFNKQGRTLDRRIGSGLELPPAALQTFGPATILVFVPIYDRVLVPALRCVTGNPTGLTMLQRVGTGMALSLAAVVEARRLETAREHRLVDEPGATVPMSWAWLVPQYVASGGAGACGRWRSQQAAHG